MLLEMLTDRGESSLKLHALQIGQKVKCTEVDGLKHVKTLVWSFKLPDQLKPLIDDVLTQQAWHQLVYEEKGLKEAGD